MKAKAILLSLLFVLAAVIKTQAQQTAKADSALIKNDSVPLKYRGLKRRDPVVATLLSVLVAGGGQFYNRQTAKGLTIVGLEVTGFVGTLYVAASNIFNNNPNSSIELGVFLPMWLGTEVYALIDAPVTANRLNTQYHLKRANEKGLTSFHLSPTLIDQGGSYTFTKPAFGLKLTLR